MVPSWPRDGGARAVSSAGKLGVFGAFATRISELGAAWAGLELHFGGAWCA